jgi:integral membrane protein
VKKLAIISLIEGISLIVLVFVGMPLKYIWGYKIATMIFGSIHGVLWLVFLYILYRARKEYRPDNSFTVKMLIFSIVPFGFIPMEKMIKDFNGKIDKNHKEGEFINA